jgi:hypothetical protein
MGRSSGGCAAAWFRGWGVKLTEGFAIFVPMHNYVSLSNNILKYKDYLAL